MKKSLLTLSLIFLIFVVTMIFVSANPVVRPIGLFEMSIYYILICFVGFFITTLIECSIGYLLIGSKRLETISLLKIIVIINAITFPFAQLLGFIFYIFFLPIIIIEILIIIVEWLLISNRYTKYRITEFESKLNLRIILFIYTLTANVLSFLVGVLVFFNPYANYLGLFSF